MRCPTCKLDTLRPIIDGPTGRETGHSVCMHCAGRPQPGVVHLTPTANRFAVEVPPAEVQWSPFELSPTVGVATQEQLDAAAETMMKAAAKTVTDIAAEVFASASGAELVGPPADEKPFDSPAAIRIVEQVDAMRAVFGLQQQATPDEIAQAEAHYADDLQARFDAIPEDAEPQAVTPEMVTKGIDAVRGKKR